MKEREQMAEKAREFAEAVNAKLEPLAKHRFEQANFDMMADFALQETAGLRAKVDRYERLLAEAENIFVKGYGEMWLVYDTDPPTWCADGQRYDTALDAFDAIHGKDERMKEEG